MQDVFKEICSAALFLDIIGASLSKVVWKWSLWALFPLLIAV